MEKAGQHCIMQLPSWPLNAARYGAVTDFLCRDITAWGAITNALVEIYQLRAVI